jgi:peptide/nickel transport system permease protein
VQSQALADSLAHPFVDATRARGVTYREAVLRHAWPVSLGPVLGLYGLMIGALFSGSFVVEVITAWPGLGRLMVDALRARDLFLVAGTAAAGAACLAVGTFAGDVVHAALDPRVREGR